MNDANDRRPVWATSKAEWAEAAKFFARVISKDSAYISHGEIQTGLSLDGKTWAPNLEERFLAELGAIDETRGLVLLRDAEGEIVAAANVTWSFETPGAPFATLQDLAVEPGAPGGRHRRAPLASRGAGGRKTGRQVAFPRKRQGQS